MYVSEIPSTFIKVSHMEYCLKKIVNCIDIIVFFLFSPLKQKKCINIIELLFFLFSRINLKSPSRVRYVGIISRSCINGHHYIRPPAHTDHSQSSRYSWPIFSPLQNGHLFNAVNGHYFSDLTNDFPRL